jgi:hypothetical protein
MIIILHGESSLLNCSMADQLVKHLPNTTIRVDERVWREEIGNDQFDSMYNMAKFVSRQGFIILMSLMADTHPNLDKLRQSVEVIEIGLFANQNKLCNDKHKNDMVIQSRYSLQIFSSLNKLEGSFGKIKDFICFKLNLDHEEKFS